MNLSGGFSVPTRRFTPVRNSNSQSAFLWRVRLGPQSDAGHRHRRLPISHLTALFAFLFLTASAAWATTTSPTPAAGAGTAPAATGGGIAGYWWLILLVIVVAAAIWYFMRGRRTSV